MVYLRVDRELAGVGGVLALQFVEQDVGRLRGGLQVLDDRIGNRLGGGTLLLDRAALVELDNDVGHESHLLIVISRHDTTPPRSAMRNGRDAWRVSAWRARI